MKNKLALLTIIGIITAVLLTGCGSSGGRSGQADSEPIQASGVVEAEQVNIAAELPGKVAEIYVAEGDRVEVGEPVLLLDNGLLLAQQAQAQAAYDAALAQLESAKAGEEAAAAYLQTAELNREAAEISYRLVLSQIQQISGNNRVADWNQTSPDEFNLPAWYFQQSEKADVAETLADQAWESYQAEQKSYQAVAAEVADGKFLEAEKRLSEARAAFQVAEALSNRPVGYTGWQEITDQVDTIHDDAKAELEAAQEAYDQLLDEPKYAEILEARARLTVARERYDLTRDYLLAQFTGAKSLEVQAAEVAIEQADAGVAQAQAQAALAENNRVSASSAVEGAEAALELVSLQLERIQLTTPISGVILTRTVEPGEVIGAGYTLLTVGDLDQLTVTVYLPEDRYGQISLGDAAELTVDSYPDEVFQAEVIWIADQAEYTPRNVQTQEERQNTVYAVKLAIQAKGILKPGMPADVTFFP